MENGARWESGSGPWRSLVQGTGVDCGQDGRPVTVTRAAGSRAKGVLSHMPRSNLLAFGARGSPPLRSCRGTEDWMMMSRTGCGSDWRLISAAEARPKWTGRERRMMGHVVLMAKYPCVFVSAPGAEVPLASWKLDGDNKPETHQKAAGGGGTKGRGHAMCRL